MKTDTPRTDEAWAAWPYAGSGMSVHVGRQLERELNAVTEQRDRLAEDVRGLLMAVTSDACKRGVLVQMTIDGFLAAHPEIQSLTTKDHE